MDAAPGAGEGAHTTAGALRQRCVRIQLGQTAGPEVPREAGAHAATGADPGPRGHGPAAAGAPERGGALGPTVGATGGGAGDHAVAALTGGKGRRAERRPGEATGGEELSGEEWQEGETAHTDPPVEGGEGWR